MSGDKKVIKGLITMIQSIQSYFTRLSQLRTIPTRNHSSLFLILVFNPQYLYFQGILKIIIVVIIIYTFQTCHRVITSVQKLHVIQNTVE